MRVIREPDASVSKGGSVSGPRSIFLNWVFLVLASVATQVFGNFFIYKVGGYSISSAFGFVRPFAAVFSGAMAALVMIGPVPALWPPRCEGNERRCATCNPRRDIDGRAW